jgi:hypothetical protein
MRRSRLRVILYGSLLALVLAPAVWLVFGPSHRISRATFEKIQVGMTKDEVDELLGAEYGREWASISTGGWRFDFFAYCEDDGSWLFPGEAIQITFENVRGQEFTREVRVANKELRPVNPRDVYRRLREHLEHWTSW